ncbi:hypothetical protein JAAARDRAFT_155030 [Jaapia argillacea MUCL 33604]|uniref:Homologous-pairing protein 2 winged helix domain-containing protein n=1 Tax=Jaapia argillacea MUCL 33604 TaxID=933084 RepID=A0A067PUL9_9AGAM|nr:hypothetical protein JAAARDRAFT_155030 [Jaapia argillacea MUCL 33604]
MNRPYGAVDVSANLKGAVPKTATQKILLSLAEKGEIVQKSYGKTAFFVVNQANLEDMPPEKLAALESEYKDIDEANKLLVAEVKAASTELNKLKSTPTDDEIASQVAELQLAISTARKHLEPLRSGTPLISASELEMLGIQWNKWRNEWMRRKKVFMTFWNLAMDAVPRQDASEIAEDLGIEQDTSEHVALEQSELCKMGGLGEKGRR